MSQSEDYLDGLLNSINKAKTDATQIQENAERKQQEAVQSRKSISPDEDFLTATGIRSSNSQSSHPNLRKAFSEDEFLRDFESDLLNDDTDLFISAFEEEIDSEEKLFEETGEMPDYLSVVDSLLNNINNAVNEATEEALPDSMPLDFGADSSFDEADSDDSIDAEDEVEIIEDNTDDAAGDISELASLFNQDDADESALPNDEEDVENEESDDLFDLDSGSLDIMDEFSPDDMDALDAAEYGDESSSDDLGLEGLMSSDDEDLLDIQALLDGDDDLDGLDIDEGVEDEVEDTSDNGKKKGKKKGKKEKKEKGEKEKNPFIEKLLRIIFGPDDEDEEAAPVSTNEEVPSDMSDEELAILSALDGDGVANESAEADGGKKKKEKKEKPKKEKKEKPKKEKKPKEPKPKKEKKPKEPDNSPKIPLPIILVFLVLSVSIIGVVLIGMNYMGVKRHMSQAVELYDSGDYIAAYEKLNGLALKDEDDILMRNQSRTLADLQQCQDEYEAFISEELYDFALDSLIKGIGRYNKYKDDAVEYGISEIYDAYGDRLKQEALDSFGVSEEKAMFVFNQKNRHYYTVELRKILIELGLDEYDSNS